ncbi:MAG: hypothetical protein MUQ85_06980 [Flavobacteriaceae bacterium]|nr:hypothetical protein [Flavobacteriaceae bacterium]MDO7603659.1 hypothetical protein [Flavobacteriaceae bacterium]
MKFDCKFFGFLTPLLFSSIVLLGQTNEVKPQTYKSDGPKKNLLLPIKDPNKLPEYLKKDFLKNTPEVDDDNKYFDRPEIDMSKQETFMDNRDYFLNKLKTPENNRNPVDYMVDEYLGDFKSNAPFVQVIFRDHEVADGDRVRILYNDREVEANVLLQERFKRLNIDLIPGFNKIEFIALNQGESGPNTAEVRVYDNVGGLIMANQWNLATGNKATLIVVKE